MKKQHRVGETVKVARGGGVVEGKITRDYFDLDAYGTVAGPGERILVVQFPDDGKEEEIREKEVLD